MARSRIKNDQLRARPRTVRADTGQRGSKEDQTVLVICLGSLALTHQAAEGRRGNASPKTARQPDLIRYCLLASTSIERIVSTRHATFLMMTWIT